MKVVCSCSQQLLLLPAKTHTKHSSEFLLLVGWKKPCAPTTSMTVLLPKVAQHTLFSHNRLNGHKNSCCIRFTPDQQHHHQLADFFVLDWAYIRSTSVCEQNRCQRGV